MDRRAFRWHSSGVRFLVLTLALTATHTACQTSQGATSATADAAAPVSCEGAQGTVTPTPLGDHAGALNARADTAVFFGGDTAITPCGAAPTAAFAGTTWRLQVACGAYQALEIEGPTPRAKHAMVSVGDAAYLFGGRYRSGTSGAYTLYNDLWRFDFASSTWSSVETSGDVPAPRSSTALVFDAKRNAIVLFGGNTSTNGLNFAPQNDTYIFDIASATWSRIANANAPPARMFHTLVHNPDADNVVLYSGGDTQAFTGPFLKDLYTFDLAAQTWTPLASSGETPLARINAGGFYDAAKKRVVIFGGHDDGAVGNQNELLGLDLSTSPARWERLPGGDTFKTPSKGTCDFPPDFTEVDTSFPERRSQFAFAAGTGGFLVMGGKTDCGVASDTWWYAAETAAWKPIQVSPAGLSCLRFSTTCRSLCN